LPERLQQDRREQLEVNRSCDRAAAKSELGRRRIIMDAPRDLAGAIDGSAQWADQHVIPHFDFRIHKGVLKPD
jgi:hypothetical protein